MIKQVGQLRTTAKQFPSEGTTAGYAEVPSPLLSKDKKWFEEKISFPVASLGDLKADVGDAALFVGICKDSSVATVSELLEDAATVARQLEALAEAETASESKRNRKNCDAYYKEYPSGSEGMNTLLQSASDNDEASSWENVSPDKLTVKALPNFPLLVDTIKEEMNINASNDSIIDTMENTGLVLDVNGRGMLLRDTGKPGVLSRAGINGPGLNRVTLDELARTLTTFIRTCRGDVKILNRYDKATGVFGGNANGYSVLSETGLFTALTEFLESKFPGYNFVSGTESHELIIAKFEFPAQASLILAQYNAALAAHGGSPADLIPALTFTTSDTGNSGANLFAMLGNSRYPSRMIRIGSALKLEHKNNATIEDFKKNLELVFAGFEDRLKKLEELMAVTINYPVDAMKRVAKKAGLPAKYASQAIADYVDAYGEDDPSNVHDLFMSLYESVFLAKADGVSTQKLNLIEGNAERMLGIDWEELDYPEVSGTKGATA